MIRDELFSNGVCVESTIVDLDAGTVSFEQMGVVTSTRPLTPDEIARYTPTIAPREQLAAALAELTPPILPEDVAAVLADFLEVL